MRCPNCGREYAWRGAAACPACNADLVDRPPGPPPAPDTELIAVFTSSDAGLIPLARSLLDAEGIEHLVRGENLQDLFGLGRIGGFNVVVGPAEFLVRAEDAPRARDLLASLAPADGTTDDPEDAA